MHLAFYRTSRKFLETDRRLFRFGPLGVVELRNGNLKTAIKLIFNVPVGLNVACDSLTAGATMILFWLSEGGKISPCYNTD